MRYLTPSIILSPTYPLPLHNTILIEIGFLFIESYADELPLLAWPRMLLDTIVEIEESFILFRYVDSSFLSSFFLSCKLSILCDINHLLEHITQEW